MLAIRKPPLTKPIILMEGTHYTAKVVFQCKMFIYVKNTLFSNTNEAGRGSKRTNKLKYSINIFAKYFIKLRLT